MKTKNVEALINLCSRLSGLEPCTIVRIRLEVFLLAVLASSKDYTKFAKHAVRQVEVMMVRQQQAVESAIANPHMPRIILDFL